MSHIYAGSPTATRYDSITGRFTTGFSLSGWFITPSAWVLNPYIFSNQTNFFCYFNNGGSVGFGLEQDFTGGWADHLFPLPAVSTQLHLAVRWDMSSGANVPRVWYNGVEQTATASTPQSGTVSTTTAVFRWHGATFTATQQTANYTCHDIVVWDSAIPVDQLLAAANGVSLRNYDRGTQLFNLPEQEVVIDRSPNSQTMTLVGTAPIRDFNIAGVNRPRRR